MKARQKGKQNAKFQFTFDLVKALRKKFQSGVGEDNEWVLNQNHGLQWDEVFRGGGLND
jgi:hypothetical protein